MKTANSNVATRTAAASILDRKQRSINKNKTIGVLICVLTRSRIVHCQIAYYWKCQVIEQFISDKKNLHYQKVRHGFRHNLITFHTKDSGTFYASAIMVSFLYHRPSFFFSNYYYYLACSFFLVMLSNCFGSFKRCNSASNRK